MGPRLRGWDDGSNPWHSRYEFHSPEPEPGLAGYWVEPWTLPQAGESREVRATVLGGYGVPNARGMGLGDFSYLRDVEPSEQTGGISSGVQVEAGGPVWENRLWALAAVTDRQVHGRRPFGAGRAQDEWAPSYRLHLGYTPDSRTLLTLAGRFDSTQLAGAGQDPWTSYEAATVRIRSRGSASLALRRQLGDRQELEVRYGLRAADLSESPWRGSGPALIDLSSETVNGNTPFSSSSDRLGHFTEFVWSVFTDGVFTPADAHTFSLGVQLEATGGQERLSRTSGYSIEDDLSVSGGDFYARFEDQAFAGFVADSFKLGSRIRGDVGVRVEKFRGGFPGQAAVWNTATASPRASLIGYLSEDLGTGLVAQFGRHFRNLDPAMYDRDPRGARVGGLEYRDFGGESFPTDGTVPARDDPRWVLRHSFEPVAGEVSSDVEHPYADRLVLGGFSTLWQERILLSLRYEFVALRRQLAIVDKRFQDSGGGAYTLVQGRDASGEKVEFYRHDPSVQREYVIDNARGAYRDRHTVEMVGRLFPDSWLSLALRGAVREDRGNLADESGMSLEWSDPSGRLHSSGRMPGFSRFEAGTALDWHLPAGFEIHARYDFFSGQFASRMVAIETSASNSPRRYVFDGDGRGAHRLPERHEVSAEIGWQLPILPTKGSFRLFAVGYNLLNRAVPTAIFENEVAFGAVRTVEDPLELQLGLSCRY